METQYTCKNERRRQAVQKHAVLNGIDYLEVLDLDAPAGSPRQRTLLVRCLKEVPAGLRGRNVHIAGGVRVTPVAVEWARRASDAADLFADGLISDIERDFFLSQRHPEQLLLVRTDATGDFSTYRLSLVQSPTTPDPPPKFDPILSRVDFSFKVECPSDFDCQAETVCPTEAEAAPVIDYLAKDYASFRQLMLDRLAVIMPDWQERSPADIGIALVEVLAYAADYLSYFQDAAATEAYLNTARRRTSVRRHARLLDYWMHDGCNARAWVCFEVDSRADGAILQREDVVNDTRTRLLTRMPESVTLDEDRLETVLQAHEPQVFELTHDPALYKAHNQISFYTWGDESCCLPKGATRATLKDDSENRLRLRPGDVLIFEERLDPGTGLEQDADPARRHAVRLTQVMPEADEDEDGRRTPGSAITDPLPFPPQPVVEVAWDTEDELPFPLCLSAVIDGELKEDVSIARGNVALADHGLTISGETLPLPQGHRGYRPRLEETGVTQCVAYDADQALDTPATKMLIQDPRAALPAVTLSDGDDAWEPQRDLLGSDRFATEFVVEMENDGTAYLRFGDGTHGREPPDEVELQATYRIGNGSAGNVGAEAIAHVVAPVVGITRVRNPLAAQGGTAPESLEEVRQYAPQAFRVQERAVTEADYAKVIERHAEVQKAMATRRWTGSWYTMFITVDRKGGLVVDAEFEDELRGFVERYRLAGHDVEIDAPRFVPLDIGLTVCVAPGYFRSDVQKALLETFGNADLPDGRRGFFHPDNFTFGQPVYLSQVIAAAMAVPGVQWVDVGADDNGNRFKRWGQPQHDEIDGGLIAIDRLEIARLDNDPSLPENGKIEFFMEGGL